jgi:hypothetical protein
MSHIGSIPTHKRHGQGLWMPSKGVRVPRSAVRCSLKHARGSLIVRVRAALAVAVLEVGIEARSPVLCSLIIADADSSLASG